MNAVSALARVVLSSVALLASLAVDAAVTRERAGAAGGWSPAATTPQARTIHAIVSDPAAPSRLYAATSEGLHASADAGASWRSLAVGGARDEVFTVAGVGGAVLAGRRGGVWMSHDGGRSWVARPHPVAEPYVPLALAVTARNPSVVYLATARHGVFRSVDGGRRWTAGGDGLPLAAGRPGLEEIRTLLAHPLDPDVAYAAVDRLGVYATADGGQRWSPFDAGLPRAGSLGRPRLVADPDDPQRLFVAFVQQVHSRLTRTRLYARTGAGPRWLPLEIVLPENAPLLGLTVDPGLGVLRLWSRDRAWDVDLRSPAQ